MDAAFEPTELLVRRHNSLVAPALPPKVHLLQVGAGACGLLSAGCAAVAAFLGWPDLALPAAAGGLAVLSAALVQGAAAAKRAHSLAQGHLDSSTGLRNRAGLARDGDELLAQARRAGEQLSLVVVDFSDLPEVREIYGRAIGSRVLARVAERMRRLAGPHGIAARTGKGQFAILLPGLDSDAALRRIHRVLGRPARIEFDAGDSEIVLVPDLSADIAEGVVGVDALYREITAELLRRRANEARRCEWLTRERERHSRPMGLGARSVGGSSSSGWSASA